MKKFITVLLTFLYVLTSTGATLQMHYCMGELAAWGMGHTTTESCGECGMKKTSGAINDCCKDEYKVFQNDNHKKTAENFLEILQLFHVALPPWIVTIPAHHFWSLKLENPINFLPPRRYDVAVYIRNCVFLI